MGAFSDLQQTFAELDTSHKIVYIAGGAAVLLVSGAVLKKLLHRTKKKDYPRDTVIVHGFNRGPYAPSLSPYVMKLETYLRVAKIPYQMEFDYVSSKKGKWPWIQYNGEQVADSEFCIRYLNSKFNLDLNKHLSVYDKGVAESLKVMSDEHLVWCYALFRYVYDKKCTTFMKFFKIPWVFQGLFLWFMRRRAGTVFYYQGTGRHSKDEVTILLHRDLKAIDNILGQKKFLLGDRVCEADCSVFAHLAQIYWNFVDNEMETYLKDTFPSLASYCERMKNSFWPDWDDCTTRGFTAEATR